MLLLVGNFRSLFIHSTARQCQSAAASAGCVLACCRRSAAAACVHDLIFACRAGTFHLMSWNCTEPPSSRTDPLLVYVDQKNPSDSGLVDDSSLFTALAGPSSTDPNATIYTPRKSAGGLRRPVGIVFGNAFETFF